MNKNKEIDGIIEALGKLRDAINWIEQHPTAEGYIHARRQIKEISAQCVQLRAQLNSEHEPTCPCYALDDADERDCDCGVYEESCA